MFKRVTYFNVTYSNLWGRLNVVRVVYYYFKKDIKVICLCKNTSGICIPLVIMCAGWLVLLSNVKYCDFLNSRSFSREHNSLALWYRLSNLPLYKKIIIKIKTWHVFPVWQLIYDGVAESERVECGVSTDGQTKGMASVLWSSCPLQTPHSLV